jgi:uncharacterized protein YaeQ
MAISATIYKAQLNIADMDRGYYADHALTLAREPSETDERLMARLLAFARHAHEYLELARGLTESDEPDLWRKDLTGQIEEWIEVGQPQDERRIVRACGRASQVALYAYHHAAAVWWAGMQPKLSRCRNLSVYQIPAPQSQALAELAQRSMRMQITLQDGVVYVNDDNRSVEVQPQVLMQPPG